MSPRHGSGPGGMWRIGPIRLLAVVGVGYLIIVLTLAAVNVDLGLGGSTPADRPGPAARATDLEPASPTLGPATATPAEGGGEVRVGSVATRPAAPSTAPPTTRPPATRPPAAPAAPMVVRSYEAESTENGLDDIRIYNCPGCSGGKKVGNIGRDMGTLQFNGVTARTGGSATVTIAYVNGESPRVGQISVNGAAPITLTFPGTGGWSSVGTMVVTVPLRPGPNTLKMFNPDSPAPDFDKITVAVR
ncbi:hypothetical protein ACFT9M_12030 [Micromonospora purpureochromogenes]|uniref:hypothetical protein n=1 Tax=Micromonospora purpureochromogenes TaxID=47872 RepID=UPI003632C46E